MDELQNTEVQIPDDINVLRKTVEDLRRRAQQLLKDKEQSEIEFGKKRAKFKELYMAREGELATEKTRSKTLQQEARQLKNELQKVISETDGYRAAAEMSERTQNEELESIHQKYQEEIASLRHIMSEDVREANEHLRKEFEADKHNLLVRNQKLEKEVATMKSLLNSDADINRPRMLSGLLDPVTNVIRRNTTSSQSSTSDEETKTEDDALSLERSMKKAQEDAQAWRSIVMPLEEELNSLKVKFRDSQEKLLIAEAKIKEGENKRLEKRAEKEGPFSREQFEELQEKVKDLNQYLEGERSARTDLEMYVAVLNTQKGVLQEDAEKLRKELHNVCRLLEQEKMEHRELKQTWQMANEQFVENLRSQGESFQRVWNVLTAEQRKVLEQQQSEPDVGQLIDLQSPKTSPQRTTQEPGTLPRLVPVVSSSSMWDNIPTVPCTNELTPQLENGDKEVVANTEENPAGLRRIHSASDIASGNISGGEMSRTRSAEELLSVSPPPVSSCNNISMPRHGSEPHITGHTSTADTEARPRVASKGASGRFDWKNFQEAVKFSHESDMNRSCAMCVNYERQLQRVQDENQKFQNLSSNLQIALDQEKKELFKEQKMRSRLEESVAHAAEDAQTRINSHCSTSNKLEKLLVGLRENFEATKHEAETQIMKLVASRDQLTQELMQLRTDYGALQNSAVQQLSQMDVDARLAEMHEQLVQIRAASESTEERLRSEVAFLKDRAIAEQVAKESLEEMLQSDVDNLKDEIGVLKAELDKERKGKEEVELQFRKSDQTLRNVEGKSKEVIIVLREQLVAANDEKGKFEGENKRLKNQLQSMTEQLNQSETVQRDFVRLSQSLQMQIAQIQESETEVRWEHPDDAKECKRCKKNLRSLKEKHHCHHCGKVFCEQCTSKTVLGGGSPTPHPVCDSCHASLNKESRSSFFNTNLADGNQR